MMPMQKKKKERLTSMNLCTATSSERRAGSSPVEHAALILPLRSVEQDGGHNMYVRHKWNHESKKRWEIAGEKKIDHTGRKYECQ